ncbi:MAG: Helix-turn-helix domain [Alphaproteobacteria bacterium]|jgi:transcriptional regulator with XRE-family HTH domain|nr:Helix-turn-helix domain [Alphaproteobacteria bacterium]MDF3034598.1 Helix-turn-helix domain [Alphaproteobacteria bacterium]
MNKKNICPEPGKRVRFLRERLGFTRKQFEEVTGFKANTLRHLETGSQELSPTAARMLSNLFIYRFNIEPDEASEDFLLNGGEGDNPRS